jgi:murein DD-endopeptidase MepM/ murein hydrolase activator NlpD
MFQIYVKAGDKVTKGQAIGQMGKTGTATGIHVHFMLWKGGKYKTVNPAPFMERSICGS